MSCRDRKCEHGCRWGRGGVPAGGATTVVAAVVEAAAMPLIRARCGGWLQISLFDWLSMKPSVTSAAAMTTTRRS